MTPTWLVRLNDILTWVNPALGSIAAILALLVVAVAADRLPGSIVHRVGHNARPAAVVSTVQCVRSVPSELRELRLYD